MRKMWSEPRTTFTGTAYHVHDLPSEPKPDPIPPIMVGGGGEKLMLYRMRQADGRHYASGNWITVDGKATPLATDDIAMTPKGTTEIAGRKIPTSQARRGDVIFYGPGGSQHVTLYLGNGQMLEAPYTGSTVKISPVRTSGMTPYVVRYIEY